MGALQHYCIGKPHLMNQCDSCKHYSAWQELTDMPDHEMIHIDNDSCYLNHGSLYKERIEIDTNIIQKPVAWISHTDEGDYIASYRDAFIEEADLIELTSNKPDIKLHAWTAFGHVLNKPVVPFNPTEAMWGGLARAIMMWMDLSCRKSAKTLYQHLEDTGRDIPEWFKEEAELKDRTSDHFISKGTRVVLIWKAMYQDFLDSTQLKKVE